MKKKRTLLILLCAVIVLGMFGFTGCGGDSEPDEQGTGEIPEQTYRVTLFFANEEYIASGDESQEKYMVYEAEMNSKPGAAYMNALELLKTSPEEGYDTVLNNQIKFNDVYIEGDTVFVDIVGGELSGGSLDETFLIGQIVNTLINTFEEVKQVQFLVDGEPTESLMGHVGTLDPFTEDLFTE